MTLPHRDSANLAAGLCVITALGRFDHTRGGQIVLWELGLVIDFPAGASIAIPSSLVTHFNVPVRQFDVRYSLTQYCSGHLCRFVENGFQTDKQLRKDGMYADVVRGRRTLAQWMDFFPRI